MTCYLNGHDKDLNGIFINVTNDNWSILENAWFFGKFERKPPNIEELKTQVC